MKKCLKRMIIILGLLWLTGCSNDKRTREKQEIVIMSTDMVENYLKEFIVTYNKESEDYYITYEDFNADMGNYEKMITNINAKIVSDRCPDLVLINYNFYQTYMEGKALEDLTPYLEGSVVLDKDAFIKPVLEAFESEGAVYGLPKNFYISTMAGRTKQIGEKQGWSIDEFITYFEENPDVVLEWDGDSYGILNFCLYYGLEEYIDFEQGKSNFVGEEFKDLLKRIKALNRNSSHTEKWKEIVEDGGNVLLDIGVGSFEQFMQMEKEYQDSLTLRGYPSLDGEMKSRLMPSMAMGITAKSKNKEAAWDILEKYMLWDFGDWEFSAISEDFEAQLTEAKKEPDKKEEHMHEGLENVLSEKNVLNERQEKQVLKALESAVSESDDLEEIRYMVLAGALEFFNDKKDLEEATKFIQNRVQLYLNERK